MKMVSRDPVDAGNSRKRKDTKLLHRRAQRLKMWRSVFSLASFYFRFSFHIVNRVSPSLHFHFPALAQVLKSSEATTPASYLSHISPLCDWPSAGRGLHLCVTTSCILNWQPFLHRGTESWWGSMASVHFTAVDGSRKSCREKCPFHGSHQWQRCRAAASQPSGPPAVSLANTRLKRRRGRLKWGETQSPMLGQYCS